MSQHSSHYQKSGQKFTLFVWKLLMNEWKMSKFLLFNSISLEGSFSQTISERTIFLVNSDQECWKCHFEMKFLVLQLCGATHLEIWKIHTGFNFRFWESLVVLMFKRIYNLVLDNLISALRSHFRTKLDVVLAYLPPFEFLRFNY